MVPVAGAMSVLAANDDEARASAALLAAEADATSEFGAAVRELFGGVAKGEHLIVLRPDQEVTPAGAADLLGVSRRIRVGDVLALAEERDRHQQRH